MRGGHGRRRGVDVEGLSGQRVCVVDQAHWRGGTDLRRGGRTTHAQNARNRQEGDNPPRDCAGNWGYHPENILLRRNKRQSATILAGIASSKRCRAEMIGSSEIMDRQWSELAWWWLVRVWLSG
jgi:hypothetical protein